MKATKRRLGQTFVVVQPAVGRAGGELLEMDCRTLAGACASALLATSATGAPLHICASGDPDSKGPEAITAVLQVNGDSEIDLALSDVNLTYAKPLGPPPPGIDEITDVAVLLKNLPPIVIIAVHHRLTSLSPLGLTATGVTLSYSDRKNGCPAGRMQLTIDGRTAADYDFPADASICGLRSKTGAKLQDDKTLATAAAAAKRLKISVWSDSGQVLAEAEFEPSSQPMREAAYLRAIRAAHSKQQAKPSKCFDASPLNFPGSPIPRNWVRPPW